MSPEGTIAVTGANRGIGAAVARELAGRGYTVACFTRQGVIPEYDNKDTASRLTGIRCDVTDPDSIKAAFASLSDLPQPLRGVVNCAGTNMAAKASEMPLADFEAIIKTNLTGTFAVCQAAHPILAAQKRGLIVNIGSHWDSMGARNFSAYCASKAGVAALTRCLGVEWGRDGIQVVGIGPGFIETDMTRGDLAKESTQNFLKTRLPLGRVGQPEEIARVIAGLFAEDVAFLTATTIYIDGGQGPAL